MSDHEFYQVVTLQRVYKLCAANDYWLLDKNLGQSDDVNIFKI